MTSEEKNEILLKSCIPEDLWDRCYISEEGVVFTPYTDNTGKKISGEESYQNWLSTKREPIQTLEMLESKQLSPEYRLAILQNHLSMINMEIQNIKSNMLSGN